MTDVVGGGPVAPESSFFTLEELKEFLGISGTEDDARLMYVVRGVNAAVAKYVKRDLLDKQHVEYVSGCGGYDVLYLREYPVTQISEVLVLGQVFSGFTLADVSESEANVGLVYSNCGPWPEGRRNIKVTYRAGYTEVPEDLKSACLQYAQQVWLDVKEGRRVASEKLGDYAYTLAVNGSTESLLNSVSVLKSYRRISV